MDDFCAPVTGTYPDGPRLPLITLGEAQEVVRLLMHFGGEADSDEQWDAAALALEIAGRLSSEDGVTGE